MKVSRDVVDAQLTIEGRGLSDSCTTEVEAGNSRDSTSS